MLLLFFFFYGIKYLFVSSIVNSIGYRIKIIKKKNILSEWKQMLYGLCSSKEKDGKINSAIPYIRQQIRFLFSFVISRGVRVVPFWALWISCMYADALVGWEISCYVITVGTLKFESKLDRLEKTDNWCARRASRTFINWVLTIFIT